MAVKEYSVIQKVNNMPVYGYRCEKCDEKFDEFLSVNDRDNPTKEKCKKCDELSIVRDYAGFTQSIGVDSNVTPDKKTNGQWSQLMTKMKKGLSPKYHHSLDRTANHSGTRWH